MTLTRPQDVLILLKLIASPESGATYARLAEETGLSTSQVYRSLERAETARLYVSSRRSPVRAAFLPFVLYGVPHAFPAVPGGRTRGMPTSIAAPPLDAQFNVSPLAASGEIPVWPYAEGTASGYAVEPLHSAAPFAALQDSALYELLALVDALREGRARERAMASDALSQRLAYA